MVAFTVSNTAGVTPSYQPDASVPHELGAGAEVGTQLKSAASVKRYQRAGSNCQKSHGYCASEPVLVVRRVGSLTVE